MTMNCAERFAEIYHREPESISFCPYRVCPIGAHSDHQLGKVTGFALNKGVKMAYSPKQNGVVELGSMQFDKRAQWHVRAVPEHKEADWANHLRGATKALGDRYPLGVGLCGIFEGSLPIGGLSSSASVILAFLTALCKVNGIKPSPQELILMVMESENKYVGVSSGKLDQSCEVLCKENHLLYLDTRSDSYELIPTNPGMKPFQIAVFFSGIERSLAGSAYNMRVDECRSAAYALMAYSGMEYGKFHEANLREVPYEVFLQYGHLLPESWRLRAEHWYTEYQRVKQGVQAWRKGDLETFGRLSFESGRSSIESWQTGSEELKTLYQIMTRTDGIYGGRFSGAGFKGCCMALIDPGKAEEIAAKVEREYLKAFPLLEGKYSGHICRSADGIMNL